MVLLTAAASLEVAVTVDGRRRLYRVGRRIQNALTTTATTATMYTVVAQRRRSAVATTVDRRHIHPHHVRVRRNAALLLMVVVLLLAVLQRGRIQGDGRRNDVAALHTVRRDGMRQRRPERDRRHRCGGRLLGRVQTDQLFHLQY